MKSVPLILLVFLNLFFIEICYSQAELCRSERIYEEFWHLFNKSYASFEEKKIDWDSIYFVTRPLVNSKTSEEQLFDLFENMITPMNDSHVSIVADNIKRRAKADKYSRINEVLKSVKNKKEVILGMTESTLSKFGFEPMKRLGAKFRGDHLFNYTNNSKVGYLRFIRCFSSPFLMKGISVNRQLDKILKSFQNMEAIIIDIRYNIGGTDEFSFKVLGHLINEKLISHYKQTKTNVEEWTELRAVKVRPVGKNNYLGKVYVISNDRTLSAADVLLMGLDNLSNVTIVGDRSNGSFSDIYSRRLSNGWKIELSNERYLTVDKINFEGIGVPVDVEAHNSLADIQSGNDSVITKILGLISKGVTSTY